MQIVRLPVSGLEVLLHPPSGIEDLLLLESQASDIALTLALLARVAQLANPPSPEITIAWQDLPVTDLDVLLLRLRQLVIGDRIQAEANCPVADCAARIDTVLTVEAYLDHHRPRRGRNIAASDEPGWYRLQGAEISFRLPTGVDQLAVAGQAQPIKALLQRCVRPADLPSRLRKRVERAMEILAPSLAHELQGVCPACGTPVNIYFDPRRFTLQELQGQAAFILQEVHLLAFYYHWPESHILTLPRSRRLHYADMVRQERSQF